jgi:hypothetical protein
MDLRRLRFAEHIPPSPAEDARRLRSLPASWSRPIAESAVDAVLKRADGLAGALRSRRDVRAAAAVRRAAAVLRRADALHAQAERLETLAQLYVALLALRADVASFGETDAEAGAPADDSIGWLQAGALPEEELSSEHGPAFRETASLRNRAFRQLEAAIAKHRGAR